MAWQYVALCDLCLADGIRRLAVARYWNEEGDEWHVCKKHLPFVIAVGLEYERLEDAVDG